MPRQRLIQTLRKVHLYFGVFITPAVLFFALTGAVQSFGFHETNSDHPAYKPARWLVVLGMIHKHQTSYVPVRRAPAATTQKPDPAAKPAVPRPGVPVDPTPAHNPYPLRVFFVIVSLGLFSSTLTGLYMAWKYNRSRRILLLSLLAGTFIPPLLLLL